MSASGLFPFEYTIQLIDFQRFESNEKPHSPGARLYPGEAVTEKGSAASHDKHPTPVTIAPANRRFHPHRKRLVPHLASRGKGDTGALHPMCGARLDPNEAVTGKGSAASHDKHPTPVTRPGGPPFQLHGTRLVPHLASREKGTQSRSTPFAERGCTPVKP